MNCPNCGSQIDEGTNFCPVCGFDVKNGVVTSQDNHKAKLKASDIFNKAAFQKFFDFMSDNGLLVLAGSFVSMFFLSFSRPLGWLLFLIGLSLLFYFNESHSEMLTNWNEWIRNSLGDAVNSVERATAESNSRRAQEKARREASEAKEQTVTEAAEVVAAAQFSEEETVTRTRTQVQQEVIVHRSSRKFSVLAILTALATLIATHYGAFVQAGVTSLSGETTLAKFVQNISELMRNFNADESTIISLGAALLTLLPILVIVFMIFKKKVWHAFGLLAALAHNAVAGYVFYFLYTLHDTLGSFADGIVSTNLGGAGYIFGVASILTTIFVIAALVKEKN